VALPLMAALAGGLAWYFFPRPRPDVRVVGGTILVYEIDRRPAPADAEAVARALQRRIDGDGWSSITVRAAGAGRVEVEIPYTADDHARQVRDVKELAAHCGAIELRVLANAADDAQAMRDAAAYFARAAAAGEVRAELRRLQEDGLPPPGPRAADGKALREYALALPGGTSRVTYRWVELGPQERYQLGLTKAAPDGGARRAVWEESARQRGRAHRLADPRKPGGPGLLQGALFYSRECRDRHMPAGARRRKGLEYFVLARNPEIDPRTAREGPGLAGGHITDARAEAEEGGPAGIDFTLDGEGGWLLAALTETNRPSPSEGGQVKRHLAIILDGLVLAAPTINGRIATRAQITGHFKRREVEALASILRAGALPVPLKPVPVSETSVPPREGGG
jgi:preprotein translocase subunit SecD